MMLNVKHMVETLEMQALSDLDKYRVLTMLSNDLSVRHWSQVIIAFLYTLLGCMAVMLNLLTIGMLCINVRLISNISHYLVNLAVADLLLALFCIPSSYVTYFLNQWVLPEFLCSFSQLVQVTAVSVSIWSITCIGLDRYFAIGDPIGSCSVTTKKWLMHKRNVLITIWLVSLVFGIAQCMRFKFETLTSVTERKTFYFDTCYEVDTTYSGVYTISIFLFTFGMPFAILNVCYARIAWRLYRKVIPGNPHPERDRRDMLTRSKAIRLLFSIVILFCVTWLPLQVFVLVAEFIPSVRIAETETKEMVYIYTFLVCHLLAMSHCVFNPLIYCFLSRQFWENFYDSFQNRLSNLRKLFTGIHYPENMALQSGQCNTHRDHFSTSQIQNNYKDIRIQIIPPSIDSITLTS